MLTFSCPKSSSKVNVNVRESYFGLKKNGKRSFANTEITEVPIGTNGPLVDSHTYTELCVNETLGYLQEKGCHLQIF